MTLYIVQAEGNTVKFFQLSILQKGNEAPKEETCPRSNIQGHTWTGKQAFSFFLFSFPPLIHYNGLKRKKTKMTGVCLAGHTPAVTALGREADTEDGELETWMS